MSRISLKIAGASGQGLDSMGDIVAKALKRSGYCVFGYREYPSLIKGGHASFQLDASDEKIESTEIKVNVVVALNHHVLEKNIPDLKPGGILIHSTPNWKFPAADQKLIDRLSLSIVYLPVEDILTKLDAKPVLTNVLLTAFVWAMLGQNIETLKKMVSEKFSRKKDLLDLNMRCIDDGYRLQKERGHTVTMQKPQKQWLKCLIIPGSKAMGLGAVHAGVRLYAGYPMTPSSPLLSYIAEIQNKTGMVIKQAEDEITAAQFVSGAMFMGARALTGTSGGGFDLMSETVSLNAIIENPTVFILAQRPGPATGLPTWTGQGDLLMAISTSHGEFTRCVLSVSNAEDSFYLVNQAFNLAEKYQISVILMTDKQTMEALYTEQPYDLKKIIIDRGALVTDPVKLKQLKSSDRYDPTAKDGVSPRWLPGAKAVTYVAQGDEHNADGTVDESAENAVLQMQKRMKKMEVLKAAIAEPELYRLESGKWKVESGGWNPDVLLVGWGSTKSVVMDVLRMIEAADSQLKAQSSKLSIGYLHFTYLWPLKTKLFATLAKTAKKIILIEGNYQGQLGILLRQQCGIEITTKILKYDGRPFFYDELLGAINSKLKAHSS